MVGRRGNAQRPRGARWAHRWRHYFARRRHASHGGDADVDGLDLAWLRTTYGKSETEDGYLWYFDYDRDNVDGGDDGVDLADYNRFRANYRKLYEY